MRCHLQAGRIRADRKLSETGYVGSGYYEQSYILFTESFESGSLISALVVNCFIVTEQYVPRSFTSGDRAM